jgi:site-specific recombinase XerD
MQKVLLTLVQSYFQEHLRGIRGASDHTVRAYQDGLRLFFLFLAQKTRRSLDALSLDDIRADAVLGFLEQLESRRGNSARTRNCRLAAVRGLVAHLLRHDLTRADQYRRILALPAKKAPTRPATYLEPQEVRLLLAQPDRAKPAGARDHALLLFLYNTGARISEALAVQPGDLRLSRPREVRIRGKGGKERLCPVWAETAAVLGVLLRQPIEAQGPIFRNARGGVLTRDGVAYLLDKYMRSATKADAGLRRRRITPHVLRHSCAVALLQSGVDLTVIRDYLGHVSVATTNRYVTTNLKMKRDVLAAFWKRAGLERAGRRAWRPTPKLLAFLNSL